jgi:hypothetical protein
MLLVTTFATILAAATAAAAVGTFFAYLFSVQRAEIRAARVEALALARTRGEIIIDLKATLESLARRHEESRLDAERRLLDLQREFAREREVYATAFTELLEEVRSDLQAAPPDVAGALGRIRALLPDERPAA